MPEKFPASIKKAMEENVKNDKDALVIIIFPLVAQNPLTCYLWQIIY